MASVARQEVIADICGVDLGDPPEYCPCLLSRGHGGLHRCEHFIDVWVPITERRFYCIPCQAFTHWEVRDPNPGSLEDERCQTCNKGRLDA